MFLKKFFIQKCFFYQKKFFLWSRGAGDFSAGLPDVGGGQDAARGV